MQLLPLQRHEKQYFLIRWVHVNAKEEASSVEVAKTERGRL